MPTNWAEWSYKEDWKKDRGFLEAWYKKHNWLEYSVAKDVAYCFNCYLFKQPRRENFGMHSFTYKGFRNWKNATCSFVQHKGKVDSFHNKSQQHCDAFRNQRQSIAHVMSRGSKKQEEKYLGRRTMILGVVRFLFLQALAFRGHDESHTSSNKGNFLELVDWFKMMNLDAKSILGHGPANHLLTSPRIQKQLSEACAKETTMAIINDIRDKYFSILVDETRDASIKEQMTVVVRYVNNKGEVIERYLVVQHVSDTTSVTLKEALDAMLIGHGSSI